MMGETGPMGLHSKGRKTDMKTAAKRERKTLRIVELALLLGAAAFLMTGGGPEIGRGAPAGEPAGTGGHRRGDGTGQRL